MINTSSRWTLWGMCLSLVLLLSACNKDEPNIVDKISGTYPCQCEVIYYNYGNLSTIEVQDRELVVERGEAAQSVSVAGHPSLELQTETMTDTSAIFVWPQNYARKNITVKFWLARDSIRYYRFDQLVIQEICTGVKR